MSPHRSLVAAFILLVIQPLPASAQDWPGPVSDVFKQVVFDPTTGGGVLYS